MTYYFIYMYQSFVKHKNYLGISNVVSWVSCCMLVVFLSQWPGRSCFTFCLSVSFFIHHIWLSYWKRRAENTGPTVLFYKFGNVSKGWSYRFLFQSFTRLGRHCKMNLLKFVFFFQLRSVYFKPQPLTSLLCNVWKLQSSKQFQQHLPDLISSCGGNGMFSLSNCIFCAMISFICAVVRNVTPSP